MLGATLEVTLGGVLLTVTVPAITLGIHATHTSATSRRAAHAVDGFSFIIGWGLTSGCM
jgi:hypothetical protein